MDITRRAIAKAAWTAPVIAVATQAPAYVASPSTNNSSINGYMEVNTQKRDGNARISFDSSVSGSVNGIPYGLFLLSTSAADVITNMYVEFDILGANIPDIFGQASDTNWLNGQRLGNIVQKDGLTYTRYRLEYTGGLTDQSNPARRELDDLVITTDWYNPPVGTNVTYWVRRFVTINGQQRFFQRRNGDNGFIDYAGEGPGNSPTPINGRMTLSLNKDASSGETSKIRENV